MRRLSFPSWAVLLLLGACALPEYPWLDLKRVGLAGGGDFAAVAAGADPGPVAGRADLPREPVETERLKGDLAWFAAFDFDKNGYVDPGEFTQAWLIRAAWTQRSHEPPRRSLVAEGRALAGLRLAAGDERKLRSFLKDNPRERALLERADELMNAVRAERRAKGALLLGPAGY